MGVAGLPTGTLWLGRHADGLLTGTPDGLTLLLVGLWPSGAGLRQLACVAVGVVRVGAPLIGTVMVLAVAALVGVVDTWRVPIEPVFRVMTIDHEGERLRLPADGPVEVFRDEEPLILVAREYELQFVVAARPVEPVQIALEVEADHVVEVNLINRIVLVVGQIELIAHLVGQVQRMAACLGETHRLGGDGYRHHRHQSNHQSFHDHCFLVAFSSANIRFGR